MINTVHTHRLDAPSSCDYRRAARAACDVLWSEVPVTLASCILDRERKQPYQLPISSPFCTRKRTRKQWPWLHHRSSWATAWSACTRARCGSRVALAALLRRALLGPESPRRHARSLIRHPRSPTTRRPPGCSPRSYWLRPVAAAVTTTLPEVHPGSCKLPRTTLPWSLYRFLCPVMRPRWLPVHFTRATAALRR